MRKAQQVIGLSVINVQTGKKLGVVRDLLFDDGGVLRGVLLEPRGFLRCGRYIPSERILSIGEDALTVSEDSAVSEFDTDLPYQTINLGGQKLRGKPVITTNGHELGQVEDVYFQEEVGRLIGYELTDGFLSDCLEGRRILPRTGRLTQGEDAIVVPPDMENLLSKEIPG